MIDLHLHLDGSLSPQLVGELARLQNLSLPEDLETALTVPTDCSSLNDYLRCFDLPVALLQSGEALTLAVRDLSSRLEEQGLLYAELRFAPSQHTRQGLTQAQAVEAAIAGLPKRNGDGWRFCAQLILCCMRGGDPAANGETVKTAARYLGQGVCALDLAGAEALYPTADSRELFRLAGSLGVPFTLHAGEAAGPESVRQALELGAQRIGHGVRAGEDPALLEVLSQRRIPLEMCPTSNLQTKAVPDLEHFPLRAYLHQGVLATVNTDNMTVSHTTLKQEFQLLQKLGLTEEEGRTLLRNSVQGAFLDPEKKALLSQALERRLEA
ncbi:MAG: adenosine deaminase [Acutalibacter sp.]|jgi:adenosine deaminase